MSSPPTNPTSRSQESVSSSNSQSHSMHGHLDVSVQTLVAHLIASKRALSSIDTVWRANELITSAREALETSVILGAQTAFVRNGISEQVKALRKVKGGIENVYKEGQRDFKNVIHTLDAANARLESTMDILRSTMVETAFRPKGEEPRSLLDFVDEQGVETMRDALKESIRDTREAQTEFDSSILAFDDDLRALKTAMNSASKSALSQSNDTFSSPIPEHLRTLEHNAQEMASLLESLGSHFDLCVTAVQHTEGGYAAVRKAASSQPPGADPVSVSGVMNTEDDPSLDEPISEEERREMLAVVQHDAAQVDDVVGEIRDFLADMEAKHEAIIEHVSSLTATYNQTKNAYYLLDSVGVRLPGYIIASQDFKLRWEETKLQIQEQLTELEAMRLFYENYYSSYDNLILEVYRRKQCDERVKNILKKAMEQIEKVYETDLKEREGFRLDAGDFLPVDLFPRVNIPPPKWDFMLAEGQDEGVGSVPELERVVVEAADRRERERRRLER